MTNIKCFCRVSISSFDQYDCWASYSKMKLQCLRKVSTRSNQNDLCICIIFSSGATKVTACGKTQIRSSKMAPGAPGVNSAPARGPVEPVSAFGLASATTLREYQNEQKCGFILWCIMEEKSGTVQSPNGHHSRMLSHCRYLSACGFKCEWRIHNVGSFRVIDSTECHNCQSWSHKKKRLSLSHDNTRDRSHEVYISSQTSSVIMSVWHLYIIHVILSQKSRVLMHLFPSGYVTPAELAAD